MIWFNHHQISIDLMLTTDFIFLDRNMFFDGVANENIMLVCIWGHTNSMSILCDVASAFLP